MPPLWTSPPPEDDAVGEADVVVLATDSTGLDAALADAKPILDKGDYGWTPETWRAFDNAYDVAYDAVDAADTDKIAAAEGLTTAQAALKAYIPMDIELEGWVRVRGGMDSLKSGTTYMIHSNNSANRILYNNAGNLLTDQLTGTPTGDVLVPNSGFALSRQTWVIEEVTGGWTVKSVDSGYYLNPKADTSAKIDMSADSVVLQIAEGTTDTDGFTMVGANGYAVSASSGAFYCSTDAAELGLYEYKPYYIYAPTEEYTDGAPDDGVVPDNDTVSGNVSNPFPSGLAGSQYFRIPAIITLQNQSDASKNGRVVAAIDARWNHTGDACSLDTIVSYSDNGGVNWNYTFANYFDDSTDRAATYGTALIDPVIVEGLDGTIYMMVDAFPGGIALNTAPVAPATASGYIAIGADGNADANGTQRLVLYTSWSGQTDDNWAYYVGDFTDGLAPVYAKGTTSDPDYYIDEYFDLYAVDSKGEKQTMYCNRLGSETQYVQQNVFYYNAHLHVRNATYLWLVTSTDGGETWSTPTIINDDVRTGAHQFLGVGPGAGLCLTDGTIVFPVYTFRSDSATWSQQIACFVYSTDNGATWKRSENATEFATSGGSSESFLVQLNATTLRQFYRDQSHPTLRYTDHTWDGTKWVAGTPVDTGVTKTYNNQLSGITYSQTINGKPAILVSTAATGTGTRAYGRIYTFTVNDDLTMDLAYTFDVTGPNDSYSYSSITELANGDVGLLYESSGGGVTYKTFGINEIAEGAFIGDNTTLSITVGQFEVEEKAYGMIPSSVAIPDDEYVKIEVADDGEGGSVITFTGLKAGTTTLTLGGYTFEITVTPVDEEAVTDVAVGTTGLAETIAIDVPTGIITMEPDSTIATATVEKKGPALTVTGGQGNLGNDSYYDYSGAPTALANALYQFHGNPTDGFTIGHGNADGSVSYMNHSISIWFPNVATPGPNPINLIESDITKGTFHIHTIDADGNDDYLFFFRDDATWVIFSLSDTMGYETEFYLYRPATDADAASIADGPAIPGYVQVKTLDEIEDGGFYLIVAYNDYTDAYYAMYPNVGGGYYSQAVKVNLSSTTVTTPVYSSVPYSLEVTGVSVGTTYVAMGENVYRINVTGEPTRPIKVKGTLNKTWDGDAVDPTDLTLEMEITDPSSIIYTFYDSNGTKLAAAPSSIGTYTLTITVPASDGFAETSTDVTFTIRPIAEIVFGEETTGGVGTARTVTVEADLDSLEGDEYMVIQITEGSGESAVVNLVMVPVTSESPTVTISYQSTAAVEVFITSGGLPNLTGSGDMGAVVIGSATAN